jgi:hypothetical protein
MRSWRIASTVQTYSIGRAIPMSWAFAAPAQFVGIAVNSIEPRLTGLHIPDDEKLLAALGVASMRDGCQRARDKRNLLLHNYTSRWWKASQR